MPDVAAPAPAPVDGSVTPSAEPVTAPGAGTPPPEQAKPPEKKRGKARHAEIRAKLNASKDSKQATGAANDDGGAVPAAGATPAPASKTPAPTEPDKPKPAVGAVMRLTAENTKLKAELDELRGKHDVLSKGETIAALRERVKKDPSVLLDVFGEDLDADENKRLERLNDAVLRRADPAYAAERERDERVSKLERERDEERAKNASFQQREVDDRGAAYTGKLLTGEEKGADGKPLFDATKYAYVNHLTKTGEIDAHRGVMFAVRGMGKDFEAANGRKPSDVEITEMVRIAADQAETYFAKRAKNWSLPQAEAPKTNAPPIPTTIGSGMGARAAGVADPKLLTKRERHEAISQRLREANRNRQATAN